MITLALKLLSKLIFFCMNDISNYFQFYLLSNHQKNNLKSLYFIFLGEKSDCLESDLMILEIFTVIQANNNSI